MVWSDRKNLPTIYSKPENLVSSGFPGYYKNAQRKIKTSYPSSLLAMMDTTSATTVSKSKMFSA